MSFSLNSLKGVIYGIILGTALGVVYEGGHCRSFLAIAQITSAERDRFGSCSMEGFGATTEHGVRGVRANWGDSAGFVSAFPCKSDGRKEWLGGFRSPFVNPKLGYM